MAVEETAPARVLVQGRAWVLKKDGRFIWLEPRERRERSSNEAAGQGSTLLRCVLLRSLVVLSSKCSTRGLKL